MTRLLAATWHAAPEAGFQKMMRTTFPYRTKDCVPRPRLEIMRLSCCLNLGPFQPHVHNPRKRMISDQPADESVRLISSTTIATSGLIWSGSKTLTLAPGATEGGRNVANAGLLVCR